MSKSWIHSPASDQTAATPATLSKSTAAAVAHYLNTAPASEFQGLDPVITVQWQGHDNLLWQVKVPGQLAVVKLFLDAGQARGRRQFDGQTVFSPHGLAPPPLWFDRYPQGLARQVLVYTWVEGITLDQRLTHRQSDKGSSVPVHELAMLIARVHTGPLDQVRRFCPHPINLPFFWRVEAEALENARHALAAHQVQKLHHWLTELGNAAGHLVEESARLWTGARPTPVHGDFIPENCLLQDPDSDGVLPLLLDWEQYGMGDPALDIARFCFHMHSHITDGEMNTFLEHYCRAVDQADLANRINVYRRILPVQALIYLLNGVHRVLDEANTTTAQERAALAAQMDDIIQVIAAALGQATEAIGIAPADQVQADAIREWAARIIPR